MRLRKKKKNSLARRGAGGWRLDCLSFILRRDLVTAKPKGGKKLPNRKQPFPPILREKLRMLVNLCFVMRDE